MKEFVKFLKDSTNKWLERVELKIFKNLFNTDDMDNQSINIFFYYNNEYAWDFIQYLLDEYKNISLNDTLFYNRYNNEYFDLINDFLNAIITDKNINTYRTFVKAVCIHELYKIKKNKENNEIEGYLKVTVDNQKKLFKVLNQENNFLYRGQTNYEWGIIPSIFRNYDKKSKLSGDYFDYELMFHQYKDSDLIEKYNATIAKKEILNPKDINYEFISYMQHSVAYSPLIDITDKGIIGLQFALGNKNCINDFKNQESSIYVISNENKDNEIEAKELDKELISSFNVKVLKKRIVPGSTLEFEHKNGEITTISCTTIKDIIDALTPKYKIIRTQLNDRMRYQHGMFILFYDFVLLDQIYLFLNDDLRVNKLKILTVSKKNLYKKNNEDYPQYNMDYLMNPYTYFNK